MDYISLGQVSVPISWVSLIVAFLITGMTLFISRKKTTADWYGNVIFIFIMIWKLSVIIFQFKLVVANPITILYFNGGLKGYWLGITAAILYTLFNKQRFKFSTKKEYSDAILTWILTVSVYELVIDVLSQETIWIILSQFAISLAFLSLAISKKEYYQWMFQIIILFTWLQGLVYSLKAEFLSVPVATYGLVAVFFSYLMKVRGDNK